MTRIILLFAVSYFLISCSSEEKSKTTSTIEPKTEGKLDYKITTTKETNGFSIKNIMLSSITPKDNINGITVSFDVEVKPEVFDAINKDGYSGLFVDLKTTTDDKKIINFRDEVFKDNEKKKFININRENFISSFGGRTIEVFIPFRHLELKKGLHNLQLEIVAFPIKYEDDNTSLNMRLMKSIANSPIASANLEYQVNSPELYNVSFSVLKAKLDPKLKDPSKYDVALSGKGYPDLFWEIFCGNDYIYYSPVEKNKTEYLKKYTSPSFFSTKDDIINLSMVDYDNGPFNTQDDIVGIQKLKTSEIKNATDTLQFGKLEYIIIQTTVEEIR